MFTKRIPEFLRHAPAPSVRGFATLAGFEAIARGMLISVFPLEMYRALADEAVVSEYYFAVGILSLCVGMLVPSITRFVPRRWVYTSGPVMYMTGCLLGAFGGEYGIVAALGLCTVATVTTFICFNAYILDYVARIELGRSETLRMFYSALGWTVGPLLGVTLLNWWHPLPFLVSFAASALMLISFWIMRLGNGKLITRARRPAPNPLAYIGRFTKQPRLIAGWLFAVIRSCGWWVYVVYLPIFAVQSGFDERTGGAVQSLTNLSLFTTPLMSLALQRLSIRRSVRLGFAGAGVLFVAGGILGGLPAVTIAALFAASLFLIFLDVCGGLPFLMAVKPSERTEMSAIYSSFRDASGIVTPGVAWIVLNFAGLWAVFVACGAGLGVAWAIAGKLHPRLGKGRLKPA